MFNTSSKKKVLIVDDDSRVRELLLELLGETYDCTTVSNPKEAFQLASAGAYSLVISDVEMPELNGIELCKQIRQASPGTAVIMISGSADPNIRTIALSAGAAAFMAKPFDLFDLEASVKSSIVRGDYRVSSSNLRRLCFAVAMD